jgi:predicted XRE-type DNA-binding protein
MLKNNIEIDVKVKCVEEQTTQAELADKVGTSASYVSRLIKTPDKIVNRTFVQMMEKLGYDIELTYKKREEGTE